MDRVALDDLTATPHAHPFDGDEPKTVRLALSAGESVPEHTHPGRTVVCYVRSGTLDLGLDGADHRLTAGDLARFDGGRDVAPTAREDCEALLVLAER